MLRFSILFDQVFACSELIIRSECLFVLFCHVCLLIQSTDLGYIKPLAIVLFDTFFDGLFILRGQMGRQIATQLFDRPR